jgi:VanZ family protein
MWQPPASRIGRWLYYVGPLLLWMLVIFLWSTDFGASNNTNPRIFGILQRLFPDLARQMDPDLVYRINFNIRKTAHVTEYAILAILAYRALAFGNPRFSSSRNVILPFLIGVGYAASDEYHQSFSHLREAAAGDVVFDSFGVAIGLLLCLWQRCSRHSPAAKTPPE